MPKFRKKPVVIEAYRWDGHNVQALAKWASDADFASRVARGAVQKEVDLPVDIVGTPSGVRVEIRTKEGTMLADAGDWIICGIAGEFYPCKPEIFAATYEEVIA